VNGFDFQTLYELFSVVNFSFDLICGIINGFLTGIVMWFEEEALKLP